jgi:hypothetical protein
MTSIEKVESQSLIVGPGSFETGVNAGDVTLREPGRKLAEASRGIEEDSVVGTRVV